LIDLHTHSTASDGRLSPTDLVGRALAAGVRVLGVTDHDTTGGIAEASAAAAIEGIELVPGIEITAVVEGTDVHILGYFVDVDSRPLGLFLDLQRRRRLERVREMLRRLAELGLALDADAVLAPGLSDRTKAVGRPWIAAALVQAGYVSSKDEAFEKWLARGRPAFVPREGAAPADVIGSIHEAGGLASLAHPGLTERDDLIPAWVADGLDAIEAYHSDHDPTTTARYLALSAALRVLVSGGSDFHGDADHGSEPGSVALPEKEYAALKRRAGR